MDRAQSHIQFASAHSFVQNIASVRPKMQQRNCFKSLHFKFKRKKRRQQWHDSVLSMEASVHDLKSMEQILILFGWNHYNFSGKRNYSVTVMFLSFMRDNFPGTMAGNREFSELFFSIVAERVYGSRNYTFRVLYNLRLIIDL